MPVNELERIAVRALQTAAVPDDFHRLTRDEQGRVVASMERDIEKSRRMVEQVGEPAPGARKKLADWEVLMRAIRSAMTEEEA